MPRPRLKPTISRARNGRIFEGYEIAFERVGENGERYSSLSVGELSLEDLETLSDRLNWYLDEGRYQEE